MCCLSCDMIECFPSKSNMKAIPMYRGRLEALQKEMGRVLEHGIRKANF